METTQNPFPTSGTTGMSGSSGSAGAMNDMSGDMSGGRVRRVAQMAHEAVDKIEQSIGTGSDKVMNWQQEYGEIAREQVRANPLAAVGIAFAAGYVISKLMR